jgi:CrcB protein
MPRPPPLGTADSALQPQRSRQADASFNSHPRSVHEDLEERQSRNKEIKGVDGDGKEAFLSELAAPAPVEYEETRHGKKAVEMTDNEEKRLKRASISKDRGREAFLSELAAPPPVKRDHDQDESDEGAVEDQDEPLPILDYSPPSSDQSSAVDVENQQEPLPKSRRSSFATELYTVSYLSFFSILGTLARMGLQALTLYNGTPVTFSLVWPNVGGSLVMGFLAENRNLFREEWGSPPKPLAPKSPPEDHVAAKKKHRSVKKIIPLYIGLATGFCGSFTSFSGFMRDSFLAMSNDLAAPQYHPTTSPVPSAMPISRPGGFSFLALLAVLLTTICLSLSALCIGAHLALLLSPVTPTLPFRLTRRILDPLMVIVGLGSWLGAVLMAIWPPDRFTHHPESWRGQAIMAIVFAPLGCILRFYVSLHLNGRIPSFPLGTIVVNVLGTIVEGMAFDLQHSTVSGAGSGLGGRSHHDLISCQVLQGINDGFCGCLTTVSTWVVELKGLQRNHAYVYGAASVAIGFSVQVIEIGSFRWTHGFQPIVCKTAN